MRRDDICLYLSPSDRARLDAMITDRNTPSKVVWRAKIVLATADGHGTNEIMRRTAKAVALAIFGAEYVLRWLPKGTHQWAKFVTPDELTRAVEAANARVTHTTGMTYNPLRDQWGMTQDTDVNYLLGAVRGGSVGSGHFCP